MIKTKCFSGARLPGALGIAGLLVAVCGAGAALAETDEDTGFDDSAKAVSNNFGELLEGMGQELKKVIGSDDKGDSTVAEKNSKKEGELPDGKSDKNRNSK
jgi:hypothetical protein